MNSPSPIRALAALALAVLVLPSTQLHASAQDCTGEFEGIVQFEARRTVVPMVICEDLPGHCPVPQPYWTFSIREDRAPGARHVEWTAPLAFGVPREPESLEIRGSEIRPGDRVRIRGRARSVSPGWILLDRLDALEVL